MHKWGRVAQWDCIVSSAHPPLLIGPWDFPKMNIRERIQKKNKREGRAKESALERAQRLLC